MIYVGKTVENEYGMIGRIREVSRSGFAHVVFDPYRPDGVFSVLVISVSDLVENSDPDEGLCPLTYSVDVMWVCNEGCSNGTLS